MIKLSIVIPLYGNKDYMIKLLDTLEKQKRDDVEVIISDATPEIGDYIDNYSVIHIKEKGTCAGKGRNNCLDIAKGNYIAFIDSDDMISDDYIETIINAIKSNLNYYWVGWKTNVNYGDPNLPIGEPIKSNWAVWGYVIRKDLIGDTRFEIQDVREDIKFLSKVLKGQYGVINKLLYVYNFMNENSITHRYNRGEEVYKKGD